MIPLAFVVAVPLVPMAFMFGGTRPFALQQRPVDGGTFAITVAGRRAGQELFEIVDVGQGRSLEIRTRTTLALPTGQTTVRGTLRADPNWRPRGGVFDTTVKGQTTRVTLQPLGDSIEAPVKSSIKYFRDEYIEHQRRGGCPFDPARSALFTMEPA